MAAVASFSKWLLLAVALVLIIVGAWIIVYAMEWPFSMVPVLVLLFIGLILLIRYWRPVTKWLNERYKAIRSRYQGVEGLDQEAVARIRRLETIWKLSIRKLRHSRLKTKGNPLYVLPWYVTIGDRKAGKTSAVRNSRISVPLLESKPATFLEQDQVCDWWFLEEAIVLDTPGRYSIHKNEGDRAEWQKFLSLLARYRKWEPLNGLIIAVSAEDLLSGDAERLKQQAIHLRERVDELMRRLGVKFPIYLLITKCDRIAGMSKFFQRFPEASLSQAMGALNSEFLLDVDRETLISRMFEKIYNDLSVLRLSLLGEAGDDTGAQAVVFPEEVSRLEKPLAAYLGILLGEDIYQDKPLLRGIYFSSAHQDGVPHSSFLPELGFQDEQHPQSPGDTSFFLRDVFGKVLKNDQSLVAPTAKTVYLRRIKQNIGLSSWVFFCLFCGVLMTAAFFKNLTVLHNVDNELPAMLDLRDEYKADIAMLTDFRTAVQRLIEHNDSWWAPRFGLNQSRQVETRLATIYNKKFKKGILIQVEKELDRQRRSLSRHTERVDIATYVDFMSRRIRLLRTAIETDQSWEALSQLDQPDFRLFLAIEDADDRVSVAKLMQQNYLTYIATQEDDRVLNRELSEEYERLRLLISIEGLGLDWLADWANRQDRLAAITAATYWGAAPPAEEDRKILVIEKAYTPRGWEAIRDFLAGVEAALPGSELLREKRAKFESGYREEYFLQWQNFILNFDIGARGWSERDKKKELVVKLGTNESPYDHLLADLMEGVRPAVELSTKRDQIPAWVRLVERYQKMTDPQHQAILKGGYGLVDKLSKKKRSRRLTDQTVQVEDEETALYQDIKAYPYFSGYQQTLATSAGAVLSTQAAYELVKAVYVEADNPGAEPQQPVSRNFWSQARLRGILGKGQAGEEIFWQLLEQRARHIWAALIVESERYIQSAWEKEVLADIAGLTGWSRIEALQGASGKMWEFYDSRISPFVERDLTTGYVSRTLYGEALAFNGAFLQALNRGKVGAQDLAGSYRVLVSGRPTDVNRSATVKPSMTRLTLECGSGNIAFDNYNYPAGKTFVWSPQDCGNVTLEIHLGDLVLEERYTGYNAFVKFLKVFESGKKTYYRKDFPEHSGRLGGYRVKRVTVRYALSGHKRVMRLGMMAPAGAAEQIFSRGTGQ